jgi:hypothetical protein
VTWPPSGGAPPPPRRRQAEGLPCRAGSLGEEAWLRAPLSFSLSFLFMGCFLGSRNIALQGLAVVPVSSVSKSVGRGGDKRLGQSPVDSRGCRGGFSYPQGGTGHGPPRR